MYENRDLIIHQINEYQREVSEKLFSSFPSDKPIITEFQEFIKKTPDCFSRSQQNGHITGSAMVINLNFSHVLLTYHAKLKKWLQLGGHADGDPCIQQVAFKEAVEESGINLLSFFDVVHHEIKDLKHSADVLPFDLDIHTIPANDKEPAHKHYDVRFLLVAKETKIQISEESLDLQWIAIDQVPLYTQDPSTLRQIQKIKTVLHTQ